MSEKEENTDKTQESQTEGPAVENAGENSEADLQAKITGLEGIRKSLEEENASLKDQYLRTKADTDNFRKRLLREKQEAIQFANKELLVDLLPIMDDFERAIKSPEDSKDFAAFRNGVTMIEKRLVDLLDRKWGLKRFNSVGEEFDPQKHEALYSEKCPDHNVSLVLEDYMTGYSLHDKILRAAKVKISMPGQRDSAAAPADAETDMNKNTDTPEDPAYTD
jgi:molecular chaperone GrpE